MSALAVGLSFGVAIFIAIVVVVSYCRWLFNETKEK